LLAEALLVLKIVEQLNYIGPAHFIRGAVAKGGQNMAMET
jgi:hypothetical protein